MEPTVQIDLTEKELEKIVGMIESSTVQMIHAEEAIELLNKFKEAGE